MKCEKEEKGSAISEVMDNVSKKSLRAVLRERERER